MISLDYKRNIVFIVIVIRKDNYALIYTKQNTNSIN